MPAVLERLDRQKAFTGVAVVDDAAERSRRADRAAPRISPPESEVSAPRLASARIKLLSWAGALLLSSLLWAAILWAMLSGTP